MNILQTLIGAIFGGSFVGLIEFLIRRADAKKDKNSEVLKRLDEITKKIAGIEKRMDTDNANDARRRILAFDDELRRHVDHSREMWDQINADIDDYEHFCQHAVDYRNNKAGAAIENIKATYQQVKHDDKFI